MRLSIVLAAAIALVMVISALGIASGRSVPAAPAGAPMASGTSESHSLGGAPHSAPIPVRGVPPPTVVSHWYAGSYLPVSAGNSSAREVSTQLTVPSANISSETNEFYYVLLSLWDNAGSYDQIGMANSFGVWGFTYSFTDYCASSYYFNPDYFNLVPGTTYTFSMMLSEGFITFAVFQGTTYVGGLSVITGATEFNVSAFYTCDSATYYDFTDYEEVYYTQQVTPNFSFMFAATQVDGANVPLAAFDTPGTPGRVHVDLSASTASTTIGNEQFALLYTGASMDVVYLPAGTASYNFTVQTVRLGGKSALTSCQHVNPGWSFSGWAGKVAPPFASTITLHLNTNAKVGTYLEYLYAYNPQAGHPKCSGDYTFVTLEVILF